MVKSALDSVVDDMAYTIMRTARSEIVRDVLDYSATLCNAKGELIAQAKTVALHLGAVPDAIARVLDEYGDDLEPGDAIILNDPYSGGMHLPDVFMFRPIFLAQSAAWLCRRGDPSQRHGRPRAGLERQRFDRDLPGGAAHPADQALRGRTRRTARCSA